MNADYHLRTTMTDCPDARLVNDFKVVVNQVFDNYLTNKIYQLKYGENPYGASLLLIVYHQEKAVAADALWRNDLCGCEAYQTADTCVLPSHRGRGLMRMITEYELDWCHTRPYYGFPNRMSTPAYIKMGVPVSTLYKVPLNLNQLIKEQPPIDEQYARWWLLPNRRIERCQFRTHHLLVIRGKQKPIVTVIGYTDKATASLFPLIKMKFFFPLMYLYRRGLFGNSKRCVPVIGKGIIPNTTPIWKLDAI